MIKEEDDEEDEKSSSRIKFRGSGRVQGQTDNAEKYTA